MSPSGYGNLGDAAIIESLIHGIRRRAPRADIVGFTLNPHDTRTRHGVEAFTCSGLSIRRYPIREAPSGTGAPASAPRGASILKRTLGWIPGLRAARHLARLAHAEWRHRARSVDRAQGFDLVVIAGGGQLDGLWGGPFGHPWTLRRWARIARRVGARFVVLSVGTGAIPGLSGLLVRRALSLASYRSYRDARSRELVGHPGLTRDDPVVPDLAYALPVPAPVSAPAAGPDVIGVSPMAYADPRLWPVPDAARYLRFIDNLADLTARIVAGGHRVVLFTTDHPDREPLAELRAAVLARLAPAERPRVEVADTGSVATLMQTLARCEVVVSARLHGVLLAHVAGRPVLAIAHERKVRTLMADMGQERFCLDIDAFDAGAAWELFREVHARRAELAADVARKAEALRDRVEAQYDQVFAVRA